MYTRYENDRVLLRPYASAQEWERLNTAHMRMFNEHWGLLHSPLAPRRSGFWEHGAMGGEVSTFVVVDKASGDIVGTEVYSFDYGGRMAYLGTWILEEHRNRGFGSEAKRLASCHLFDNLGVELVMGVTLGQHELAIGGLRSTGLRHMGIRPCMQFSLGEYRSMTYFGFSREDWLATDWRLSIRCS